MEIEPGVMDRDRIVEVGDINRLISVNSSGGVFSQVIGGVSGTFDLPSPIRFDSCILSNLHVRNSTQKAVEIIRSSALNVSYSSSEVNQMTLAYNTVASVSFEGCWLGSFKTHPYTTLLNLEVSESTVDSIDLFTSHRLHLNTVKAGSVRMISGGMLSIRDSSVESLTVESETGSSFSFILLHNSDLRNGNLARLSACPNSEYLPRIINCDLRGTDFTGAWLPGTDWSGSDLRYCKFEGAYLYGGILPTPDYGRSVIKWDSGMIYDSRRKIWFVPTPMGWYTYSDNHWFEASYRDVDSFVEPREFNAALWQFDNYHRFQLPKPDGSFSPVN